MLSVDVQNTFYIDWALRVSKRFMMDKRKTSHGKGDTPRAVDYKKWSENWDKIFPKKKKGKCSKRAKIKKT